MQVGCLAMVLWVALPRLALRLQRPPHRLLLLLALGGCTTALLP